MKSIQINNRESPNTTGSESPNTTDSDDSIRNKHTTLCECLRKKEESLMSTNEKYQKLGTETFKKEEYHLLAKCYLGTMDTLSIKIQELRTKINRIETVLKERNITA
jgi:hypothetical protein